MLYDATAKRETVKISNTAAPGAALLQDNSDYQLFVNGKEQICVMQVICFLNNFDKQLVVAVGSGGSQWQAHQCVHLFCELGY